MAEHKRAEEKLRKGEAQYRTMLELADVGASQVDPFTGRFLYVNPKMSEITGYSEEELLGMRFLEVTHPGDREEDSERLQRMVRGEATECAYEKRYVRKDGQVVWVQVNATLNRDETGRPLHTIAVIQEITERKWVKEALRKSEEFHRFAVEAGRIGTWDLDLRTEECRVSPKMAELMSFSTDQTTVPGAQWWESIVPDDRTLMASALAASIDSNAPFDLEFRIALKDGTERWLYSRGGVSRDVSGKALRVHGASIDVTERKRAEENSRASEERLRRAVEIETVGVIFFKTDGSITDANDAFLRMSGYSREDLVEGLVRWDAMTPSEWMPHSLKAIEEFKSTGRTIPYEKEYLRKDGSRWWALFAAKRLDEEEGVEFIIDTTQSKQAEEALRESSSRIENILESITEEFFAVDREWRFTYINERSFHRIQKEKGEELTREELLGKNVWKLYPELVGTVFYHKYHEALREQKTVNFEAHSPLSDTWYEVHVYPSEEGLAVYYHDISERKRAQKEIEIRTHQQAVVAELGLWALASKSLPSLMADAVALVARTLDVEYCKIMELLPSGEELQLRMGIGWKEGLVGRATEGTDLDSQAGYTLRSGGPVITEDLHTEKRFRCPPLLHEHGAVSGMTVVIQGREQPFGVLGAHTKSRRTFSEDDVNFLQAVANMLAMRIEREEADEKLQEVREAERSRMARDLHDEALRDLSDALAEAQHIQSSSKDPKPARQLGHLVAALKRVGQQLRGAIYNLRLGREQDRSFAELLDSLVELHRTMAPGRNIRLNLQDGVLLGPLGETGRELLRIVGEALTNARRHSGAWNVWVAVETSEGKLWAEISDDGQGLDLMQEEPSAAGGMGIRGMRERARALGGDLKIESELGKGTKVRFEMALKKDRKEPEEEIRVLLVEDHASFREALASVLVREPHLEVVGQVGTLAEARKVLEDGATKADVAIVDLALPDGYGGDLIKELRKANSETQALVLSASLDRAEIAQAIESGAAGVLHKSALLDEVAEAVLRLKAGETLLPLEEVVELLRFAASRREQEYEAHQVIALLTSREKEVLQALAEGLDSQEIAERLQISIRTERNHMASILNKLRVHSRLQALVFALRHGVVDLC